MAAHFQFVMRSGPNVGKVFPLDAPEVTVGRDNSNMIAINDPEVSRRHARLELRGSAYVIQDLGSTNGTFVNGQRISGMQVLNPGDTVSFGEGIMVVLEAIYDPNATVVAPSSARTAAKVAAPVRKPAPAPAPVVSTPPPAYSGQVPAGPEAAEPAKRKKGFPVWVVIVILLLVVVCACVVIFTVIDKLNVWCSPGVRIITNIIATLLKPFGYIPCS